MDKNDLVARSQIKDLVEEMEVHEKRGNRHLLFAVLGVSPGALLPMLGLLNSGAMGYVVALSFGVMGVELWRGLKARSKWRRMRELKEGLEEGLENG